MRFRIHLAIAFALVAALLVPTASAGASPPATIPIDTEIIHLEGDDSLLATAKNIAASQGMSVEHSLSVMEHQEAMDLLQEKIHDLDPQAYGGAVHDLMPAIGTTIFVKGPISPAASALVRGVDNVTLESTNVSLAEVRTASQETAKTLDDLGFNSMVVGADMRERSINVELSKRDFEILPLEITDLEAVFRNTVLPVNVSVLDGDLVTTEAVYGGGQLGTSSTPICTAAFTVTSNSTGAGGVMTAAHCPAMSKYTTGPDKNLYYQGAALTSQGDAEWHTTSGTEDDRFYISHGATSDVSGLKHHLYMDEGDLVCRYGRTTGDGGCVTIVDLFISAAADNGVTYGSMVRVGPTGSTGGDSGGPWYNGTTAWGIHHGSFSNGDGAFSAVSIVDGNMGVTLKTS